MKFLGTLDTAQNRLLLIDLGILHVVPVTYRGMSHESERVLNNQAVGYSNPQIFPNYKTDLADLAQMSHKIVR